LITFTAHMHINEPIIEAIDRNLLEQELTEDRYVRPTNYGKNDIYIFDGTYAPYLMQEVGRLRELSFRQGGGGTGKPADIDSFDTGAYAYKQLIVWNPEDKEIVGGYRYAFVNDVTDEEGSIHLSTSEIFEFLPKLINDYFPYTIELGRSFVQPKYQPSKDFNKGLFSLDNLWDGLGALIIDHPEMKYFFGKVTMYENFNLHARDLLYTFIDHYFKAPEGLVKIPTPVTIQTDCAELQKQLEGLPYKEGYKIVNSMIRALGENIPPLYNSYMNTSPSMYCFGTAVNNHFGNVLETGILVNIKDIYPTKKDRHVQSYVDFLQGKTAIE
jgi:hypothetical protein